MGVVSKGGQYQVVIGSDASVYKPLSEMCEISTEGGAKEDKNGKKFLERLVDRCPAYSRRSFRRSLRPV